MYQNKENKTNFVGIEERIRQNPIVFKIHLLKLLVFHYQAFL